MNTLQAIEQIVHGYADHQINFDNPVRIKITPHQNSFEVWAVNKNDTGLWLMDGNGEWHGPLREGQVNADKVINSLYQRLRALQLKAA
jgi:hypothetical protein